jgi:hypothetical protein
METVEVKILQYTLRFRKMSWREEFTMKFEEKENRVRALLAHALTDISGLKVESVEDAKKVLSQIPTSLIDRVFIIYKGSQPDPRRFSTMGLYRAPEPNKYMGRIAKIEEEREQVMDRAEEQMASKFGMKELMEAREREREMLRKGKGRGLTRATPDGEKE